MKLIVGLGNPGVQYERTRHNAGFMALDRLAGRLAPGAPVRAAFHGATIDVMLDDERIMMLKPATYMNRSGLAVGEAVRFFKIDPAADLLVLVDDVALPCGSIRLRTEGGAGGHNGLADIERALGTKRYPRLRIGIDRPGQITQIDYVLGRFSPDQIERMEPAIDDAADAALCWARHGAIEAMNQFNRREPGPQATKPETPAPDA